MKYLVIIGAFFALVVSGCSSSHITSSWKAENISPKSYKKIMVLGLIGEPDRTVRENMEEHLAGDLKELGYNAVTSVSEYGPKAFENIKEEEAIKRLNDNGVDAVVTVVLLSKSKEKYYTPGRIYYTPYYSAYHSHFWRYYSTMYWRVYSPGYYTVDTKYFWETNFYDLSEKPALLYSAQSQSFDEPNGLAHDYGKMIVKDMVAKNLLQKQTAPLKSF